MDYSSLRLMLAGLLLAGTAGCAAGTSTGGDAPASSPVSSGTSTPSAQPAEHSTVGTPSIPVASAPAERVFPVVVSRTGGFAGVDDRVSIAGDGTVVVDSRGRQPQRTSLPAATLAELRRLLATSAFALPASASTDTATCADGFQYRIESGSRAVVVHDCGDAHGAVVDRLLAIVTPMFDG